MAAATRTFSFIPEGGETGALIRATAWERHPLGPVADWPPMLKSTLAIMLGSRQPMILWWGAELYQFYNDAFIPALGPRKHPKAMGERGSVCWMEAWDVVGPQIDDASVRGIASWYQDACVPVSREGQVRDAYWTYGYSPVNDAEGNIVGVLNIVTETTPQVHAHRRLHDSAVELKQEQRALHHFLMQVPVGVAMLSGPAHVYTLMNPAFREVAFGGRPASDFLGRTVREALPELEGQGFYELLDGVYRTGKAFVGTKLRATLLQADGHEREIFINFTYQAWRDEAGGIEGIVAVIYEVTDAVNEQKEIELMAHSLRSALVSRDVFLGVASHELNTPITALMLQSDNFQRRLRRHQAGKIAQPSAEKFAHDVFVQSKRLERLVSDMLDVSRLDTGRLSIVKADCNLSELLSNLFERFLPQMAAASCEPERDIMSGVHADVDAIRIEQVVSNLLINAIKYAPKSTVRLALTWADNRAIIRVSDNGPGIAPANQARIFGRFERAIHANEVSGLGLGLYISEHIVLDHHGRIYVESALGQGSTFVIELPGCRLATPMVSTHSRAP